MKRILAILLTNVLMCLTLSNYVVVNASVENEYSSEFKRNISVLSSIGVLDEDFSDENETISRQKAIYYSMILRGGKNFVGERNDFSEELFTDVDRTSTYFPYIVTAAELGIIEYGSKFRPDDEITMAEVIKIFTSLIGYGVVAKEVNDYPNVYINFAQNSGVLKGISFAGVDIYKPITLYAFSKLMLNTLKADIFEITGIRGYGQETSATYGYNRKENLLSKVFDIDEITGIVETNKYTSLYKEVGTQRDSLVIDGTEYLLNDVSKTDYIGLNTRAYVKNNSKTTDQPEILYIEKDNEQQTFVKSEKILPDTTVNSFRYYDNRDRTKTIDIPKSATLIYNDVRVPLTVKAQIIPEIGCVELIDNNRDGKIDVIKAFNFTRLMIGNISYTDKVINSKLNSVSINLKDDNDMGVIIEKNGKSANFTDLKVGDVLFYSESPSGIYKVKRIIATNEKFNGVVSSKSSDEVEIESKTIKVSPEGINYIAIRKDGTFYLDPYGYIYYAEYINEKVYGYLNAIYMEDDLDELVCLKIFTENGRWVKLACNKKVRYNGSTKKAIDVYTDLYNDDMNAFRQLVTYMVNDEGKITELNTAKSFERWSGNETVAIANDTFRLYRSLDSATYRTAFNSFGNEIALNSDTKIFMIPTQTGSTSASESDFSVVSSGSLVTGQAYNKVAGYDNNASGVVAACVCIGNSGIYDKTSNIAVVKSVVHMLDNYGDVVGGIECMFSGSEITLPVKDVDYLNATLNTLKKGDIIQVGLDFSGSVETIVKLFNISNGTEQKFLSGNVYSNSTMIAGKLLHYDATSGLINIDYDTATPSNSYTMFSGSKISDIYVVDTQAGNRYYVDSCDVTEIMPGRYAFLRVKDYIIQEVVIFK